MLADAEPAKCELVHIRPGFPLGVLKRRLAQHARIEAPMCNHEGQHDPDQAKEGDLFRGADFWFRWNRRCAGPSSRGEPTDSATARNGSLE